MLVDGRAEDVIRRRFPLLRFSCLHESKRWAALTFPIDQCAEAVKSEHFEVAQAFRVCRANLHSRKL